LPSLGCVTVLRQTTSDCFGIFHASLPLVVF
jgi:hypothetical protein